MENYVHFSISMFLFRLLLDLFLLKRQSCGSNYCRRIYLMKVGAYVCLSYDRNCFKGFEKYTPAVQSSTTMAKKAKNNNDDESHS